MKKNLAVLLAALMLTLVLAGCGSSSSSKGSTPSNGVTTVSPSKDSAPPDGVTTVSPEANPTEEPKNDHVVDYKIDIPDGFEPMDEVGLDACWYREDGSSINLVIAEKDATTDASFQVISADLLRAAMVEQMNSIYGLDVEITDRYFTKNEMCGLPSYQYCYDMSLEGQTIMQIIVSINADKMYTFSYTANSEDVQAAMDTSSKNIQLIFG